MARGSPIVPVRVRPLLLYQIDMAIERANYSRSEEPYNRSTWILACIVRQLLHLERAKKCQQARSKRNRDRKAERSLASSSSLAPVESTGQVSPGRLTGETPSDSPARYSLKESAGSESRN